MNKKVNSKAWKMAGFFLLCLLILCGCWMLYDILKGENDTEESTAIENVEVKDKEVTNEESNEIEVLDEVCNIYDIVGNCSVEEIISAEVYINVGTAQGQSYTVEKDVAPKLLQALIAVAFKEEDVYQEIVYEQGGYSCSIEYEFSDGEKIIIYVEQSIPDMIIYNGVVYKSYEEIDWEVINYGIREGFSRGNEVKDIE